jgi:hypothetical protein
MSWRSLILGLLLALAVSALTYFNNHVALQAPLVGTQLPLVIVGSLILVALVLNPLLGWLRMRLLTPAELAVAFGLGAVACAFPESGLLRYLGPMVAMPAHHEPGNPAWVSQRVMAYAPGSPTIGHAHVTDWRLLAQRVAPAAEGQTAERDPAAALLWRHSGDTERRLWSVIARSDQPPSGRDVDTLLAAVNRAVWSGELAGASAEGPATGPLQRAQATRAALTQAMPGLVMPTTPGRGLLLLDGYLDPDVTVPLATGGDPQRFRSPADVPWRAWAPTIVLWCGVALLLALASLCLALIVFPQWSRNELLTFPIAVVLAEFFKRSDGGVLPDVVRNKSFQLAAVAVLVFHTANGWSMWLRDRPVFPMQFDFSPLRDLFPYMSRPWQSSGVFTPSIELAVVAFAFFLPRSVSFSFGIATPVFCVAAGFLLARGVQFGGAHSEPTLVTSFTFGGFVAAALMIAYLGRRYYAMVVRRACGLASGAEAPASAAAALWLMIGCAAGAAGLLVWGGLSPGLAITIVGMVLMTWLVVARIVAETGLYRIGGAFWPVGIITGIVGYEAIGPTALIIVTMLSVVFTTDIAQAMMPFAVNGLQLAKFKSVSPARVASAMAGAATLGLVVAVIATLTLSYHYGFNARDEAVFRDRSAAAFSLAQRSIEQQRSVGTLQLSDGTRAGVDLSRVRPDWPNMTAMAVGLAVVIGVSVARLRVPGWPIHPAMFLLLGNWGLVTFGFSFLIGWAIKSSIVGVGGTRAYKAVQPAMIGIIVASVMSAVIFLTVGWVYFLRTGLTPVRFVPF